MRVEIGGGPTPAHADWVQFDAIDWQSRTGLAYVLGDVGELPWHDGVVEEIFASNVLEHVSHLQTAAVLQEWARVLAPGGRLTIVVPDLLGLYRDYFNGRNTFAELAERVYGSQTYELDFHKAGFDQGTLRAAVESVGLRVGVCRSSHGGGGVHLEATRA